MYIKVQSLTLVPEFPNLETVSGTMRRDLLLKSMTNKAAIFKIS